MKDWASMTLTDIAFGVCTAFDRAGSVVVLTGGGAAVVYAPESIQSLDLDFVLPFALARPSTLPVESLGFERRGQMYRHPDTPFSLEFIAGPLAVGAEVINSHDTLHRHEELLHIISPQTSVMDRLAAAIHWDDFSSIRQAAAICAAHPVDLGAVATWAIREGGAEKWQRILAQLQGLRNGKPL